MNMLISLYIWLSTLFGVPAINGEAPLLDVGDRQTMSSSSKGKSSSSCGSDRGLTRKSCIYNGF